jgi:16S rRNA processing protein RimM
MRLVVARVGRAHGIRGEVTVEVRTDVPERRFLPGTRLFVDPDRPAAGVPASLVLTRARDHSGVLLLSFEGVSDRDAAEALRGARLEAEIDDEAEDEPDAWFDHQLVGLPAFDPSGRLLGEIVAVEHPGAQDRLVVRRADGVTRLVPFVAALVPTVDPAGGRVVIDAPPGLIED